MTIQEIVPLLVKGKKATRKEKEWKGVYLVFERREPHPEMSGLATVNTEGNSVDYPDGQIIINNDWVIV